MAKGKLDFKRLPVADKVIRGQQIVGSLTGNEGFPTPNPPLAQITAARAERILWLADDLTRRRNVQFSF